MTGEMKMKKSYPRVQWFVSMLLALTLLLGSFALPAGATAQWDAYWSDYVADGRAVYLAPGADDTEMRFAWMGVAYADVPYVLVSKNSNMSPAQRFDGLFVSGFDVVNSAHVTADGLEENTTYYYRCVCGAGETPVQSFKTGARGDAFSAVFVTDIHISGDDLNGETIREGARIFNQTLNEALVKNPGISLIVSGGDQADSGRLPEYIGAFAPPAIKSLPFALTAGNHDYKTKNLKFVTNNPNVYTQAVSKSLLGANYWFVKGNTLFLMLDTSNSSTVDHYNFVQQAVAANPDIPWRVAVFHHDLYGGHKPNRESENRLLRLLFTPIFDRFGVDLVLTGHSHITSRTHVLYREKIALDTTGMNEVTDAPGTIYYTGGSIGRPRDAETEGSKFLAFDYVSTEERIYTLLDFDSHSLTMNTYILGSGRLLETFTLNKTVSEPRDEGTVAFWYPAIKWIGTLVNVFNNLSREFEYRFGS